MYTINNNLNEKAERYQRQYTKASKDLILYYHWLSVRDELKADMNATLYNEKGIKISE